MAMRLPRPRFTVRRLMVAVAIVATVMAPGAILWRRSADLARRGREHDRRAAECASTYLSGYHERLAEKYATAARRPWLPVEPDPPEPK